LVMTVAYSGGVNYTDTFGTVGIWESTIYRRLMKQKTVPPLKKGPGDQLGELVGGYVKEPVPGMYDWVVSFDLNSLYPHLMLQYNMSPETYIPGEKEFITQEMVLSEKYKNNNPSISVCANGAKFSNEKVGIIPQIVDEYYSNRKKIKTEMLNLEKEVENEADKRKKAQLKKKINQLHNSQMAIKILKYS